MFIKHSLLRGVRRDPFSDFPTPDSRLPTPINPATVYLTDLRNARSYRWSAHYSQTKPMPII
ncbi:hypothetical protein [Moorena sp. SIO3I6]|uniref:hypothetical protein n=1 Tax=Moorena sp. SIO3I6 TaxID=2607831 RepID=UPI0013F7BAD1|nr:hypothetical protein [Moorena sp. SIO3I6]NEP27915.1 hypothetical protein [Moorena sp. SIO3I6]